MHVMPHLPPRLRVSALLWLGLALLLLLLGAVNRGPSIGSAPGLASLPPPDAPTRARVQTALRQLPLTFIENQGQTDSQVAYAARSTTSSTPSMSSPAPTPHPSNWRIAGRVV